MNVFVTPRADAIARLAEDILPSVDRRRDMIAAAAKDMQRMERFLQACFLDFVCECDDPEAGTDETIKCRACAARQIYFDGLKAAPPTAYTYVKQETPK